MVSLRGAPRARGQVHGEHFAARIHDLLERWHAELERCYGVDPRRYVDLFFAETGYAKAIEVWAPSVGEEVQGIAEGSGVDYKTLLAFQHVNEEFEFGPRLAKIAPAGEACSTIVSRPHENRPALLAQNLDLAQYLDGHQVLLRVNCDESDGDIMMLTVPGMISLMGMNSHGLAVCDNTLTQLRTDPNGVPVFALYRLIMECKSCSEAQALIERVPHAVGLNWVIGDSDRVVMLERSATQTIEYGPGPEASLAYHTNHPLKCVDWQSAFEHAAPPRPARSTYLRFAALHQRLQGADPAAISVQSLKEVLASRDDADYPVSRGGGRNTEDQNIGFTLACNVFELRRGDPIWHLASGPPHATSFRAFRFD
jgi:isopenicillin-N N-acyltransferase-like protein